MGTLVPTGCDERAKSQFAERLLFKSERTLIRPVAWLARAGCDPETHSPRTEQLPRRDWHPALRLRDAWPMEVLE
jgi:hypothetical protein